MTCFQGNLEEIFSTSGQRWIAQEGAWTSKVHQQVSSYKVTCEILRRRNIKGQFLIGTSKVQNSSKNCHGKGNLTLIKYKKRPSHITPRADQSTLVFKYQNKIHKVFSSTNIVFFCREKYLHMSLQSNKQIHSKSRYLPCSILSYKLVYCLNNFP